MDTVQPMEKKFNRNNFRFSLVMLTAVFFFVFKLFYANSDTFDVLFFTWCFESCVFFWIFVLSAALERIKMVKRFFLPEVIFCFLFVVQYGATFFYNYYFQEAAVRKFSLLDVDPDSIAYFFENVLPGRVALFFFLSFGVLGVIAFFARRVCIRIHNAVFLVCLAVVTSGVVWVASSRANFPTPLVNLCRDICEIWSHAPLDNAEKPTLPCSVEKLNRSIQGGIKIQSPYKKVLVFVLEQITRQHLDESVSKLPPDSFFQKYKGQFHEYDRFYASNQDSRTGELSLLTARFIPYEAYTEDGRDHYLFLSRLNSLVDLMNENGYQTAIAASQTEEELVVSDLHWKHKFYLTQEEISQAKGTLCFNPYEFEHSCEDKMLLERLTNFVAKNEKVFLFQTIVWGHSYDYYNETKKSEVQYVSEYLGQLIARLGSMNLLGETLLVVTSDHGIRDKGFEADPATYRIPLIFVHAANEKKSTPSLFSQIDFQNILLSEMTGDASLLPSNDFVMFVGPTSTSLVGAITKEQDFLLIRNRKRFQYVLANVNFQTGASPKGRETPLAILTLFENYRDHFNSKDFR
jgi:hypothetical protein